MNEYDWSHVDDEPWSNADLTAGPAIYTGAWITGAIVAFPVLFVLALLLVRRWLR